MRDDYVTRVGRPGDRRAYTYDGSEESAMAVRYARAVRALIRPEHITEEVIRHGAIYGGWARRARVYYR